MGNFDLQHLADTEGYTGVMNMIEDAINDSVAAGLCDDCGFSKFVEPDQKEGYCENCETFTVKSCLVICNLI